MPTVRVFIPTYRRPQLLARAVESLRRQTMADWICELHNDAPDDDGPGQLMGRLRDPRFVYRRHERNLGGTATFNLIFRPTTEPFHAMLEDDNTWEPDFLATMLATARAYSDVTVFWCNQRLCQEQSDGTFRDTGRLVHPYAPGDAPRLMTWGQPAQISGALHAHGAMLVRSRPNGEFTTPAVPIALVEAFRERMFPYPLVFVPQPLATFSLTLATARSDDRTEWAMLQTMLTATFLKHAQFDRSQLAALWTDARKQQPPATGTLIFAGLAEPACRALLHHAAPRDWLRWLRGVIRRPRGLWRVLRSRRVHADWWEFLDRHTATRFSESGPTPSRPGQRDPVVRAS